MEDISTLQGILSPSEISALFPLNLDIPLTAVKNVKNDPKGKVALTKNVKVQFTQQRVVPPPPPPPPPPVPETEIDAVLSEVTSSRMEQISYEVEKKLREDFAATSKWNLRKRLVRFLSRGRKRKKLMEEEKARFKSKEIFSTNARINQEMMSASERHNLLRDEVGAEKDASFDLQDTTKDAINVLSSEYLQ